MNSGSSEKHCRWMSIIKKRMKGHIMNEQVRESIDPSETTFCRCFCSAPGFSDSLHISPRFHCKEPRFRLYDESRIF